MLAVVKAMCNTRAYRRQGWVSLIGLRALQGAIAEVKNAVLKHIPAPGDNKAESAQLRRAEAVLRKGQATKFAEKAEASVPSGVTNKVLSHLCSCPQSVCYL